MAASDRARRVLAPSPGRFCRIGALFLAVLSGTAFPIAAFPSEGPPAGPSSPHLTPGQWKSVVGNFESAVLSESSWLDKRQRERASLKSEIQELQEETSSLREKAEKGENVIDDIRLKGYLNRLKDLLERDAELQREWDATQKDFEQKALSLVSLYNDRIETELETTDVSTGMDPLDSKLKTINFFIQKRTRVQSLSRKYERKRDSESAFSLDSLESLKTDDKESLQLTLGLFRDRQRELEDGLEKLSLEEDETKNELKLQGKMLELMQDIGRMNSNSGLPQGDAKNGELAGLSGKNQEEKLEAKLADLQQRIAHDERTLIQINLLMGRIQRRLDHPGTGAGP